jgi:hypothetical protein
VQNTNYTYSVTAESAGESVPNLSIATSPNTGILGGGQAFIPNVTDGNKDAVGNDTNSDGGLTYNNWVGTEALVGDDVTNFPNFKPTKYAGLFGNGDHADFTVKGVSASATAPVLMHADFTFLEVIDSQADHTIMTAEQVKQSLTVNGKHVDTAGVTEYTVHSLADAPMSGLLIPDSQAGTTNTNDCVAYKYKGIVAFSVSARFVDRTSGAIEIGISGLPSGQKGALMCVATGAQVTDTCVVHYWPPVPPLSVGHVSMTLSDGTYISWWPTHKWPIALADKTRTLAKDTADEGSAPVDFTIHGVDTKAISDWYTGYAECHDNWVMAGPNCTTVVEDALSVGGVEGVPTDNPVVISPIQFEPTLQRLSE